MTRPEPDVAATPPPADLPAELPRSEEPRWARGLVVCCGVAFGVLSFAVVRDAGWVAAVDADLHAWVLAHRVAAEAPLVRTLTWVGATYVALPALVVIGALAPPGRRGVRRRLGSGLLLAGVASLGVYAALLVNQAVGKTRPAAADWWGPAGGPAFPSGHTTTATVVALLAAWALSARGTGAGQRRALWASAAVVALAVGCTRVWLGVHWPSDVVGGWLWGTAWSVGAALVLARSRRRTDVR